MKNSAALAPATSQRPMAAGAGILATMGISVSLWIAIVGACFWL